MRVTCALLFLCAIMCHGSFAAAQPCNNAGECSTGFCVDDVCCDTACDTTCMSCSTIAKGGGVDGECGFTATGGECVQGSCDGTTFSFVPPDTCDGNGACVDGGPPVSCYTEGLFDLGCGTDSCSENAGCEVHLFPDGAPCADGLVCNDARCDTPAGGGSSGDGGDGGASTDGGGGAAGGPDGGAGSSTDSGCGCRIEERDGRGTIAWVALAAWLLRRRRSFPRSAPRRRKGIRAT